MKIEIFNKDKNNERRQHSTKYRSHSNKKKEKRKTNVEPNDKVFLFIKKEFLMTTLFRKRKQKCKYITFKYHQERDIKLIIMER
jgi:hypothetical protein